MLHINSRHRVDSASMLACKTRTTLPGRYSVLFVCKFCDSSIGFAVNATEITFAWTLQIALALKGFPETILDSYTPERRESNTQYKDVSIDNFRKGLKGNQTEFPCFLFFGMLNLCSLGQS
jgi:hypothetical protein